MKIYHFLGTFHACETVLSSLLLSAVISAAGRACWEGCTSEQLPLQHRIYVVQLAVLQSSAPKLYVMAIQLDLLISALSRKASRSPGHKLAKYA